MIGCGFDAEVVNRVHGRRTGHISLKDYLPQVRDVIRNYGYPEIRASLECGDSSPLSFGVRRFIAATVESSESPQACCRKQRRCIAALQRVAFGPLAVRVQSALLRRRISDRAARRRVRRAVGRVRIPQRRLLAAFGGDRVAAAPPHGRLDRLPRGAAANHLRRPGALPDSTAIPADGCRWTSKCCPAG